jgi:glycosyltransferase involved in cell wall biosynthesis
MAVVWKLFKLLWYYRPDIVYCHSSKAGAVGRMAALFAPGKVIYNAHGWAFNMRVHKRARWFYRFVETRLTSFCKRVICISNFEGESALKYHVVNEKKLRVIFNGVEIDEIRKNIKNSRVTREQFGIPEGVPIIGMVGRISEQKAPDTFIRMAEKISLKLPDAHFMIVGDGENKDNIERMISNRNLQNIVHITGWVSNPNDYMALFDVGVLLSRWEGFGLVICEYMAAGIPLVSTKTDAIPDLVEDGVNGLLVDIDDEHNAAGAVLRILNDETLRSKLIENGTRVVEEKFSIERVAKEHEALFEEIL